MAGAKILIVEDDEDILEMIAYNLKKESYKVLTALDGEKAVLEANKKQPDLIILDLMLPGIDGLDVCKTLKKDEATARIPIIMVTAKSQEVDKIVGLELGADDYITKPFSPKELLARIKAVLRRYKMPVIEKRIVKGDLIVDKVKFKVIVFGKEILLTSKEFKILEYLSRNPGIVLSRDKILDGAFGYDVVVSDRTIDAHIKSLRKKLGKARDYIETVRGIGYRFKED